MNYPDKLIRGISNKDDVEGVISGFADSSLFKKFQAGRDRNDDYLELSINWCDDAGALDHILQEEKEPGVLQFKFGAAILCRKEVDRLCKRPATKGKLAYERNLLPNNKYHGNILLDRSAYEIKKFRNMIASGLAICIDEVVDNE